MRAQPLRTRKILMVKYIRLKIIASVFGRLASKNRLPRNFVPLLVAAAGLHVRERMGMGDGGVTNGISVRSNLHLLRGKLGIMHQ